MMIGQFFSILFFLYISCFDRRHTCFLLVALLASTQFSWFCLLSFSFSGLLKNTRFTIFFLNQDHFCQHFFIPHLWILKLWVFSVNFGAAVLKKHCVAAASFYPSIHLCTLKKMCYQG